MSSFQLPICSVFFSLLLLFAFSSKKRVNILENKLYFVMIICSAIDSVIATVLRFFTLSDLSDKLQLVYLLNRIDFALLITICTCLFSYVVFISFPKIKENIESLKKYFYIVLIIDIIAMIGACFGSIEIIEAGGELSISGPSLIPVYITCGFYLVGSIIISLMKIKNSDRRYIPIFVMIFLIFFLIPLFQYNPYLMVISITITFTNYLMYHTIENPDLRLLEQVNLAKDYAEKANAAKSDFLSSMSHEIRTPLNAVVGFSDCILTSNDIGEIKENAADIINASQTLLEIVNGILDISKIEAGKMEIIDTDYDTEELFRSIKKLAVARLGDKPLELNFNIAEDLPKVLYGDHANVKKIILNIITNAMKYTEKGKVDLNVKCIFNKGICRLIMVVEDTGRGIKKEHIDKLFTKFQRLDEDRNTTIEGTGLGLAITKRIIELMGGQIVVQSVYGVGSRFTIAIDQRISTVPYEVIKSKEKEIKKNVDFSNKKVLVIDDNKLNVKVAKKILEEYRLQIDTADSGFECVEKIEAGLSYDLILLDDMMPKMSGVETLKKLENIAGFSIPTVALTANAITGMREKYLKDGFSDYLVKPIEKNELDRVLNYYLGDDIEHDKVESLVASNFKGKRVLVVDDNKLNIMVATKFLKIYKFAIDSIDSGNGCIDKIKSGEKYDLIFMDDMMPEVNGVLTLHALEKIDGFNIPVVALTANALDGARKHYLNEGFSEYLAKPIDKFELDRIINKLIDNKNK